MKGFFQDDAFIAPVATVIAGGQSNDTVIHTQNLKEEIKLALLLNQKGVSHKTGRHVLYISSRQNWIVLTCMQLQGSAVRIQIVDANAPDPILRSGITDIRYIDVSPIDNENP